MKKAMQKQNGQIVIILLLIMLVGLVIAITITQRSVNDLTVSTQTEQSTRAFSAAEAGIERAVVAPAGGPSTSITLGEAELGNQSQAKVKIVRNLPRRTLTPGQRGQADEEPVGVNKDTVAQFWLADPNYNTFPLNPANIQRSNPDNIVQGYVYPSNTNLYLYYGNENAVTTSNDMPAIEVTLISYDTTAPGTYVRSLPMVFDSNSTRQANNNFVLLSNTDCPASPWSINTDNAPGTDQSISSNLRHFKCRIQFTTTSNLPILMRVRVLYANNVPMALQPDNNLNLPYQKIIYTSTGKAGQSVKTVQVSRKDCVYLPFFDFAIFSGNDLVK